MSKLTFSLVLFLNFLFFPTTFSAQIIQVEKILEEIDKTDVLLIKSEFNNFQFTIKEGGQELVSPDYSGTFLLFTKGFIGIHNINNALFHKPALLSGAKQVNASPNPVLFYTKEGDMLSFDKKEEKIIWNFEKQEMKIRWVFENFEIASAEELQKYKVVYGLEKNTDLSDNTQNLIGLHRIQAINRYSEYYIEPIVISNETIEAANGKDLVLYFESKEDPEIGSILIFDEYDQCKYLIHYYPSSYYSSIMDMYTQFYGDHNNRFKWQEIIGSKNYVYQIQFFDEKFGLEVKKGSI